MSTDPAPAEAAGAAPAAGVPDGAAGAAPARAIVQVDGDEVPWADYQLPGELPSAIRSKRLLRGPATPAVQYVEYGPGQTDPRHHHDTGELFLVTEGQLWLGETPTGPGGVVYIPAGSEYAARAGPEGTRYFRVVTPD